MQENFNYVEKSLELFPRLTKIMFGWQYDMREIENKLSNVRVNDCLDRNALSRIMDAKEWDYRKFWPDLVTVIDPNNPITGIFKLGGVEKKETISFLYKRFLHIEVVSIILRFVDPQNYAIISPPVEKFFSLQPKEDHIEYYVSYLAAMLLVVLAAVGPGQSGRLPSLRVSRLARSYRLSHYEHVFRSAGLDSTYAI